MTYSGTGVAIVTPFQADGSLDLSALKNLIDSLIQNGIDYIVSLGTTGETATLTWAEKKEIVQTTIAHVNGRVPVMVGCGGNNTTQVVQQMAEMETWATFHCFLSVSPYYNKPSQEGLYQHYKAVAQSTSKQILLYNVPGRTSRNMQPRTVLRLAADFPNIIGLKEAGNSLMQSIELSENKPENFTLLSGDDDLLLAQLAHGFDGVISVVANAYPTQWSTIVQKANANQLTEARHIFHGLLPFVNLIFAENNPGGIKCALNEMQHCENVFRLPVCPVNGKLDLEIRNFVNNYAKQ